MSAVSQSVSPGGKKKRMLGEKVRAILTAAAVGAAFGSAVLSTLRETRLAAAASPTPRGATTRAPAAILRSDKVSGPGVPPSRNVTVPATIDANGRVVPEHVGAHFLFTLPIESQIHAQAETAGVASSGDLTYNGGPVMEGTPTIYLVFYQQPSILLHPTLATDPAPFSSDYVSGITNFFNHAANSPFSSIITQYTDSTGVGPSGTFNIGGVYTDRTTVPPSGNTGTQANPLTDNDIQNEIAAARVANPSWPAPGLNVLYEIFTAPNVWEAYDPATVSFKQFCAYHAISVNLAPTWTPYAYIPYEDSIIDTSGDKAPCYDIFLPVFPNGPGIDKSSQSAWHETNESITDPLENAWITNDREISDLCNDKMGDVAPNGANSVMNGLLVQVQQLWNNTLGACAKRLVPLTISLPPSLDFGTLLPGGAGALNVQNDTLPSSPAWPGNAEIFDVDMASGSDAKLGVAFGGGTTIVPGGSASWQITVSPSASGKLSGKVEVWTDDSSRSQPEIVSVSATVGSPTPIPTPTPGAMSLSANPVIFPNAGLGEAPTLKNLLIQNLSAKGALAGNVGAPSGPFSITSGNGSFKIGPLGMLKVRMTFMPTGLGLEKGSLIVTSNDQVKPSITVKLRGTGEPGVPSLSASSLAFGRVGIGLPGKTLALKIHNTGLGALSGSIGALTAPFAVISGEGAFGPIAPGGVQSVNVQFTPTRPGAVSKTLVVVTNDPAIPPINVPISGTGGPGHLATNVSTAPTFTSLNETLAFGGVKQDGAPKLLSFKIKNVGTGELLGNVGSLVAPFAVTAGGAFNLAPGAIEKVTVAFAPTALGHVSQPLAITVRSPSRPPAGVTVTVAGRGT